MVTTQRPDLVLQQIEARDRRKRSISPELLRRFAEQDQRLFDLIVQWRAGDAVADEIVDELLPMLQIKADRMSPVRIYGRGDLYQELTSELLHTARTIPLRGPPFLTRRLVLNAAKNVTRRLEREWYRQLEEWYRGPQGRSARRSTEPGE